MNYSLDAKSFKSAIDLYKTFALDIKSISKAFLVGAKADLEVKVDEKEVWSFAEKNDLKYSPQISSVQNMTPHTQLNYGYVLCDASQR